jgi:hypothetical protein
VSFLDFLFKKTNCPLCGTKGARVSDGRTRCPNPSCQYFDSALRRGGRMLRGPRQSDYSPVNALYIRYRNFQGQEKAFTAEKESLRRTRNHIIARVAPTGENISLSRDRIQNLSEVEAAVPHVTDAARRAGPTPRERQVLAYHKKHKSTSRLCEQIRAKYPEW